MRSSLFLALLSSGVASSAECGQLFSADCKCDTDVRYCADGDNGASDDILDQHPVWSSFQGFYSYSSSSFAFGLYPATNEFLQTSPSYGFVNHTFSGSRSYRHRYSVTPPSSNGCERVALMTPEQMPPWMAAGDFICGVTGLGGVIEGFGTSSHERDGSIITTTKLQLTGGGQGIAEEDAVYKQTPVNNFTVYGYADSSLFFVTQTFVFTNEEKTTASAVEDVFQKHLDTTVLVQSTRMMFTKLPDAEAFVDGLMEAYEDYNVTMSSRKQVPMDHQCSSTTCPTEAAFCEIDPRCSPRLYTEPSADLKAGPIVGLMVACFVVIIGLLYLLHRRRLLQQQHKMKKVFATRIARSLKIKKPSEKLTAEALAEEFKKIDRGPGPFGGDGQLDRDELWAFVSQGAAGEVSQKDFSLLFQLIDLDNNGSVSFLEFAHFMESIHEEIDAAARRPSLFSRASGGDVTSSSAA